MDYFKFEDEFAPAIDIFATNDTNIENVIMAGVGFYNLDIRSEHIIDSPLGEGPAIKSTDTGEQGLLIGKMSFKMIPKEDGTYEPIDIENDFALVPYLDAPITGIKINLDAKTSYQEAKTFKFIDKTASKDADLSNLVLSSGNINEDNPDESTYKEYGLTPEFNKQTNNYTVTLLEKLDTINVTATKNHEKSTMKIKVPKRDSEGNLVYESDGTTIEYEQKEITDKIPKEVTLNKLGEPDTIITIIVTSEAGGTKEYEIAIHRPYGIIKGSIYTAPTDAKGIFKSDIRVYKTSEVDAIIDKSQIVEGRPDDVHDKLLTLKSQDIKTNDDGTYEIYVIPGTYDILIDKPGYLDHIYFARVISENQTLDLGLKEILAGDTNKDGVIEITDYTKIVAVFGMSSTDLEYSESNNFNDDEYIEISDYTALVGNYLETRKIE